MVRLAMQRDLPFDPAHAVIDFVEVDHHDHETIVLVAAIQQQSIDHIRSIAQHAGLKVDRISLRCMGLGTLLRARDEVADHDDALLSIDVSGDGVEFAVMSGGSIRFSRAAKIADADEPAEATQAIVTETKRSWMSYRIVEDAPEVSHAYVFGDDRIANDLATEITDLMKVRVDVTGHHSRVETDGIDLSTTWPLVGLLLEAQLGFETIDFAHPKQAPDRAARRRLLAYAGAAAVFLLLAFVGMLAFKNLSDMRSSHTEALAQISAAEPGFFAYERDHYRLEHITKWQESHVDWLAHLEMLAQELPAHDRVVLDQIHGSLRFNGVDYDSRTSTWSALKEITLTVDGEAATQPIIDDLRRQLAFSDLYQVHPTGPDTAGGRRYPYPFKMALRSGVGDPNEVSRVDTDEDESTEQEDDA